jgi:hypothetical protein
MSVQEPYKIIDINFNNIIFKKTKLISNKKIIFLKYKENKLNNFVIQLSKIKNNNVNNQNEIEFIIDNSSYTNFFEKLDDFIVEKAQQNHSWFDHLENTSSMNYQRTLMDDNSIKLRLCNNKELVTKLIVNDEVVSNFDDILSNESTTKMIIEIYAVWIKTNSFGLLLRPINILMKFKENPVYNYKFLENSDNDSPVYELSESHFQSEKNNINTLKSSKSYKSSKTSNSDSNSDSNTDSNSDSNSDSDSDSDNKLKDNNKINNQLFIKPNCIFMNNSSLSTSDNSENDLNKLILG